MNALRGLLEKTLQLRSFSIRAAEQDFDTEDDFVGNDLVAFLLADLSKLPQLRSLDLRLSQFPVQPPQHLADNFALESLTLLPNPSVFYGAEERNPLDFILPLLSSTRNTLVDLKVAFDLSDEHPPPTHNQPIYFPRLRKLKLDPSDFADSMGTFILPWISADTPVESIAVGAPRGPDFDKVTAFIRAHSVGTLKIVDARQNLWIKVNDEEKTAWAALEDLCRSKEIELREIHPVTDEV
ncbi:hypothetical protein JCM10908_007128 [Rhodotorula pacifica]|uniref:uncharacterized protein n=1 Tax=Rhodotorula pacifica TaxID=1495444 RepID=UPI00316CF490